MRNNDMPFPLAYLDWCKTAKGAKTMKETENRSWIAEFYSSPSWNCQPINGIDYAIAMGLPI